MKKKKKRAKKPVRAIHALIAEARNAKGLSQQGLADLCDVDKSAVSHWECGLSQPKSGRWPHVAKLLGLELGDLYREVG